MLIKLATSLLLVLALAGCSDDGDGNGGGNSDGTNEPSTTKSSETTAVPKKPLPSCDDIWKTGATLPTDYEGCGNSEAATLSAAVACEDGRKLVIFDASMYAITGEKIETSEVAPLEDTDAYSKVYATCTGD